MFILDNTLIGLLLVGAMSGGNIANVEPQKNKDDKIKISKLEKKSNNIANKKDFQK